MAHFSNNRNTMSMSSTLDSGNVQCFNDPKPIRTHVQPGDHTPKQNDFTDNHGQEEPTGCSSSVIQCTQETSFSGLKYIFAIERTALTRYEICTAFIIYALCIFYIHEF